LTWTASSVQNKRPFWLPLAWLLPAPQAKIIASPSLLGDLPAKMVRPAARLAP
jgi:hypothetical protein